MRTIRVLACLSVLASILSAESAFAAFNLQVTEIWPGNAPGNNLTEDWFEITNSGDMSWIAANDGNLWYDDVSADVGDAVLMTGIVSIAPGESVIYVLGDGGAIDEWIDVWEDVVTIPQVGSFDGGSGLGQGGDGVAIWITAGLPTGTPDLFETFPNANSNGGQSWDSVLAAFSVVGNDSGAVATLDLNNNSQPAIGSPGMVVPEPGTITLAGMGVVGLLALSYRRRRAK